MKTTVIKIIAILFSYGSIMVFLNGLGTFKPFMILAGLIDIGISFGLWKYYLKLTQHTHEIYTTHTG